MSDNQLPEIDGFHKEKVLFNNYSVQELQK
jgi:hypothetical protein